MGQQSCAASEASLHRRLPCGCPRLHLHQQTRSPKGLMICQQQRRLHFSRCLSTTCCRVLYMFVKQVYNTVVSANDPKLHFLLRLRSSDWQLGFCLLVCKNPLQAGQATLTLGMTCTNCIKLVYGTKRSQLQKSAQSKFIYFAAFSLV